MYNVWQSTQGDAPLKGSIVRAMQTLAGMLQEAAATVLSMQIGAEAPPLSSLSEFSQMFEARSLSVDALHALIAERVGLLDGKVLLAEVRNYKDPPARVRKVLLAALCLSGFHDGKSVKSWESLKKRLSSTLFQQMATATTPEQAAVRAASRALADVSTDDILDAPFPIQHIAKWCTAMLTLATLDGKSESDGADGARSD